MPNGGISQIYNLALNTPIEVALPTDPGLVDSVLLYNYSPYLIIVKTGVSVGWLGAWSVDRFATGQNSNVQCTPTALVGQPPNAGPVTVAQLAAAFILNDEAEIHSGTYPCTLLGRVGPVDASELHIIGTTNEIAGIVNSGNGSAEFDFQDISGNNASQAQIFAQRDAGANAMILNEMSGVGAAGVNGGQSSISLRTDALEIKYTRTNPSAITRKIVLDNGDYTPFVYQNGWGNVGAPYAVGAYYLTPTRDVRLRGRIVGGTVANGTVITQLPLGYRPSTDKVIGVTQTTQPGTILNPFIVIRTNGNIECWQMGTSTGEMTLENITFDLL